MIQSMYLEDTMENALEAADAMASKLEKGTSFKNYEKYLELTCLS